ncbi:MAG: DUF805 domain-containing protein [Veillonella sp.]|uniref:DUF805 domain-containing protein n=1 Tax=Veillonella sp. TaxID=1926307 RepID=UPI0025DD2C10|nr:DUF805 domain-containing protein [Veillonella sp.]MBS4913523.1 DUF805 domain-containing protein [Veillonella sp.]
MFCENCGQKLKDDARFCSKCGTQVSSIGEANPNPNITPNPNVANPNANAANATTTEAQSEESFSWTDLFKDIPGRYNRSEYWWRALGYFLIFAIGLLLIADMTDREIKRSLGTIGYYIVLIGLLAVLWGFARCVVKRFHDANYSGYYLGGYYLVAKLATNLFDIESTAAWIFLYTLLPYIIGLVLPTHGASNEWGDPK